VWIDLTVPADLGRGVYRGRVTVKSGAAALAEIPLELEVLDATMPRRPIGTMLFYEGSELEKRIGDAAAVEPQLWQLLHSHRLVPIHAVGSVDNLRARLGALDGSLYTPAHGYRGPAAGVGDDVVVLGMYGTLSPPTADGLRAVERIADELAAHGIFDRADVVLYASDENCASPSGAGWRQALAGSANPNARRVRVTWTCSEDPAAQPVDVPIVSAGEFDASRAAVAGAAGKTVWIYNGQRPASGTLLTDTEAVSMRTYGWIAAMTGVPRWFIWETTAWYDANYGGHGRFDPFVTAETFHNDYGEASMGDGVLLYPGRQVDAFREHSMGFPGVLPSIRLKNLRRGIQDAGYLQLARSAHRDEADRIARALFPRVLGEARAGKPVAWPETGEPFFVARRALAALIAPGAVPDTRPPGGIGAGQGWLAGRRPFRLRTLAAALLALAVIAVVAVRARSRRRRARNAERRGP
jgi:hypothetical protein